jgi:hypothetical protein
MRLRSSWRPVRAAGGLALGPILFASIWVRFVGCGGPEFVTEGGDGGSSTDSSATIDAPDAPLAPFCSTVDAGFCSDFDQQPLPESWHIVSASGGASGVEDDNASVSPPSSYLAITPATSAADAGVAAILTSPALAKGNSHIGFDVRIDELSFPAANNPAALVVVAAYTQGTDYAIALEFHPTAGNTAPFSAALLELTTALGKTTSRVTELSGFFTEVGAWYSVALDFGIDTADAGVVPASITVTGGGGTNMKVLELIAPVDAIGGARYLSVGAEASPPTGEAKIRFDNVTYSH